MDEFKLIVENAAPDEQVVIGILQPSEKVVHQVPDSVRRGSDMNGLVPVKNTDAAFSERAGFIDKTSHHRPMGQKEVLDGIGIEFGIEFVGLDGVLDLLNFFQGSDDLLAFQNRLHFTFGQGISLDGQGRVDGFDSVGSPETQGILLFHPDGISFQLTGNLRNQIDGLGRYGEGWFVHGLFRQLFRRLSRHLFRHKDSVYSDINKKRGQASRHNLMSVLVQVHRLDRYKQKWPKMLV